MLLWCLARTERARAIRLRCFDHLALQRLKKSPIEEESKSMNRSSYHGKLGPSAAGDSPAGLKQEKHPGAIQLRGGIQGVWTVSVLEGSGSSCTSQ